MFQWNTRTTIFRISRLFYASKVPDESPKGTFLKRDNSISFDEIKHEVKVPLKPIWEEHYSTEKNIEIDSKIIQLLERLSLVDLDDSEALITLKDSIKFADQIRNINTSNVQPLYTVLENRNLRLREDRVTDGNIREDILRNAKVTEEDYFVAPPGNIPLEQEEKHFK